MTIVYLFIFYLHKPMKKNENEKGKRLRFYLLAACLFLFNYKSSKVPAFI